MTDTFPRRRRERLRNGQNDPLREVMECQDPKVHYARTPWYKTPLPYFQLLQPGAMQALHRFWCANVLCVARVSQTTFLHSDHLSIPALRRRQANAGLSLVASSSISSTLVLYIRGLSDLALPLLIRMQCQTSLEGLLDVSALVRS